MKTQAKTIRPFTATDTDAVARVWWLSGVDEYSYVPKWQDVTEAEARAVFAEKIAAVSRIWVGLEDEKTVAARAFYEQHGFVAVRFGTSPPPESLPDVEYHWRPS